MAARTIFPRIAGEKPCEPSRKLGRSGKKIPAACRAMTDRFVVLDGPAPHLKGSGRCAHGAVPRTGRAGLVIAEEFELSLQGLLDGPPDDGLADLNGQGFEGIEVDVQPRAVFPVGPPGDNFSPSVGHVAKLGQILGLSLGEGHGAFVLELGERGELENSA
jgi:hypothetical protein